MHPIKYNLVFLILLLASCTQRVVTVTLADPPPLPDEERKPILDFKDESYGSPAWLTHYYDSIIKQPVDYDKQIVLTDWAALSRDLVIVFLEINDGVCSHQAIATFYKWQAIEQQEIYLECDMDASYPAYKYMDYATEDTLTFDLLEMTDRPKFDSVLDFQNNFKEDISMHNTELATDSVWTRLRIQANGQIKKTKLTAAPKVWNRRYGNYE